MNREQAAELVRMKFRDELQRDKSGKGFICPICGSGSGRKGTGITENPRSPEHFTCWAGCFQNADAFDIIAQLEGVQPGTGEAMRAAYERYGIEIDRPEGPQKAHRAPERAWGIPAHDTPRKEPQAKPQAAPAPDFSAKIKEAREAFEGSPAETYIQGRGISSSTARRYWLGYSRAEYFPGEGNHPALIIPASRSFYTARNMEAGARYSNPKGGHAAMFNRRAISEAAGRPVFVTEGAIDALSIIEAGGLAVALNSAGNFDALPEYVAQIQDAPVFVLCLDPDEAGRRSSEKLQESLEALGVKCMDGAAVLCGEHDANDALVKQRDAFLEAVRAAEQAAVDLSRAEAEAYKQESAAGFIGHFMDGIDKSVNAPAIPTGFFNLDTALDGGLYPGLYFVGAISSLGKTTFCLQICDQIAAAGNDVLVFSLEMARAELMAKSISRLTYQKAKALEIGTQNAKTVRGITDGKRWEKYNDAELSLIASSVTEYGTNIAPRVWIFEGMGDVGVDAVRQAVKRHISLTERKPVVLIDYVQILAPFDARASDKQNTDKAVLDMQRISRDYKIPVIGISSFNRDNYSAPVSMISFKESGAIEYSSDVLIGLQLEGVGTKEFNVDEAKAETPRKIELKILKNRNGATGGAVLYHYYPQFNYFQEQGIIRRDAADKDGAAAAQSGKFRIKTTGAAKRTKKELLQERRTAKTPEQVELVKVGGSDNNGSEGGTDD